MDDATKARFEYRARIMKAMAHPSRLFILDELSKGERCVCELTEMIGVDVSTVSKHLSILRNASIVDTEKRGTQVYYRLITPCLLGVFDCVESALRDKVTTELRMLE